MSVLEKTIEKAVRKYAESGGCITFKMNGAGHRGWPDRMFLYEGQVLFIEFKRQGKTTTPLQAHIHDQLRKQGFDVFVVDDAAMGKVCVEGLWATGPSKPPKARKGKHEKGCRLYGGPLTCTCLGKR